jgi:hypothetical protein
LECAATWWKAVELSNPWAKLLGSIAQQDGSGGIG